MLIADNLAIDGRHLPLLESTSFAVARGELLLIAAEPQPTRTALALGASARMRPSQGTVAWLGNTSLKAVRRISTLVDSPEINEPEAHLKVRDLVAEDLALLPGPIWRRSSIDAWLKRHHLEHLAEQWLDALNPLERLTVLTHLALEDRNVELLVFDTPDRHGIPEDDWCNHLHTVAAGRRAPAVIGIVQRIPENWSGSTAYAGEIQEKLDTRQTLDGAAPESTDPESGTCLEDLDQTPEPLDEDSPGAAPATKQVDPRTEDAPTSAVPRPEPAAAADDPESGKSAAPTTDPHATKDLP